MYDSLSLDRSYGPTENQYTLSDLPRTAEVTPPAAEPLSLTEAKKQLEIPDDDDSHDVQITGLIAAARIKWETDTQRYLIERAIRVRLPYFREFQFPHRPVTAITAITYYDTNNAEQTLSSDVYQLDTDRNQLRIAYNQSWPVTLGRFDAVTISYTLGSHTTSTTVPELDKAAMKLLLAYYFENRDMLMPDNFQSMKAYEMLVMNNMRSSYP